MADTARTFADLTTNLFQDGQPAGSITPQDARDFIASLRLPHGAAYITASAATVVGITGTYYLLAGTFADPSPSGVEVTSSAAGRLTYTGVRTLHCFVNFSFTFSAAANNQTIAFKLYKNGAEVVGSIIQNRVATGTDERVAPMCCEVVLSTNDYVEVYVTNETSAANVTAMHGQVTLRGNFG